MATGVTGYFDISGTNGASVRVWYQETYDTATNKSSVAITNIFVKSSSWYGVTYYLSGYVNVAGSTAVSMSSSSGTYSVRINTLGVWAEMTGSYGSVSGITHNDDGTKSVSISISVRGYTTSGKYGSGWSVSGSKTVTLTTIARKSTLTATNGTLGTAQTLTISRQSSSFYHSIRYTCGDVDAAIVTKTGDTSISFTPSLNLAKQNATGTSVSITFTLYTFASDADDATEIGQTTKTITCAIPDSVKPSCSIGITDVNSHVATFGGYVQGQSDIEVIITGTEAQGSPITDYTTTADGKTYKTADFEIAPIAGSGSLAINATVKDQRGRTGTASKTITVLPYAVPAISLLSVHRCNSDGTENQGGAYVKVTYSFDITSLSSKNGKTITLKYKKTSDTTYTSKTLTSVYAADSATTTFAADTESSYDVVLVIADSFGSVERNTSVSTAYAFMDWDYGNKTFALGKIAEKTNAFECGWTQYDKFGTLVGNGLAAYTGGGDTGIDPDTTLESLILTSHTNAPQGLGTFYYIQTTFYNAKSVTTARSQVAHPYNKAGSIYYRYYTSGAWSAWARLANTSEVVGASEPGTAEFLKKLFPTAGTSNYIATFGNSWANGGYLTPAQLQTTMQVSSKPVLLWNGSWSSGSLTVAKSGGSTGCTGLGNISDYKWVKIFRGAMVSFDVPVYNDGLYFGGVWGNSDGVGQLNVGHIRRSGNVLTYYYNTRFGLTSFVTQASGEAITAIYGTVKTDDLITS